MQQRLIFEWLTLLRADLSTLQSEMEKHQQNLARQTALVQNLRQQVQELESKLSSQTSELSEHSVSASALKRETDTCVRREKLFRKSNQAYFLRRNGGLLNWKNSFGFRLKRFSRANNERHKRAKK